MIEVRNLTKTFFVKPKSPGLVGSLKNLVSNKREERIALHPVDFTLQRGEFVGLIGANGAGKTTLIKMLSGIVVPSAGEALVAGHIPHHRDLELRKKMALIMGQKAGLWWDLPALDCFLLLKEIYQLSDQDYRKRLDELTETLGVGHVLTTPIRNLSLGERMKMELMACLLHHPEIIFLDEPTIGLDLVSQKKMRAFLKDYAIKYRPLIILTSHYMEDIDELCSRALILKRGRLVYDGNLSNLKHKIGTERRLKIHLSEERAELPKLDGVTAIKKLGPLEWSLTVPKELAANVASIVLSQLPVHDFSYEAEDLGDVIEKVFND